MLKPPAAIPTLPLLLEALRFRGCKWGWKYGPTVFTLLLASTTLASDSSPANTPAQDPENGPTNKPVEVHVGEAIQHVVDKQANTAALHRQSQQKIEKLDDRTQSMLERYLNTVDEQEVLQASNNHLRGLVARQTEEIEQIRRQIDDLSETRQAIIPLVDRMVTVIDRFVALDIPFLTGEREKRIQVLKQLVKNEDGSIAEQFRRILQAYQIEVDYGRTVDAYESQIYLEGSLLTVQILRIGRIGLYYLSQDESQLGYWDSQGKHWVALDSSHRRALKDGIAVAKKQRPPSLLELPLIRL